MSAVQNTAENTVDQENLYTEGLATEAQSFSNNPSAVAAMLMQMQASDAAEVIDLLEKTEQETPFYDSR